MILKDEFNHARALTQNNEIDEAIALYEKILQAYPKHSASHYNLAQLAAKLGDIKKAHQHLEQVVTLEPDFPQGHFQLAQMLLVENNYPAAIDELEIAVMLAPDYIDALHLLACSAMQQQQISLAEVNFQQLLNIAPHHASAHLNFALLKLLQKNTKEAIPLLDAALMLDPTLIEAHYHRGVIAMQRGEIEHAILEMHETIDRQADHFAAIYNLAILYKMQHHYQLATHFLKRAQALKPEDESITFLLHAFLQDTTPPQAPKAFVQDLFNHYAQDYDVHMQKTLRYQVPTHLRALFNDHVKLLPAQALILDLGCGTGLSAAAFKDLNAQFIGVDLASEMLAIAKSRGIYHTLTEANIITYMQSLDEHSIDMIIAADVLGYFGALDEIFATSARVLKKQGLFLFSVELSETQDYLLQTAARYAHSKAYIEHLAAHYGFHLLESKKVTLREQEHQDVLGEVFLYRCE